MPRQSYRPASAKRPAKPQRRARKPHTIDMPTMCATLLLLLVGLIALFSASYSNALYTQGSATKYAARHSTIVTAVNVSTMRFSPQPHISK